MTKSDNLFDELGLVKQHENDTLIEYRNVDNIIIWYVIFYKESQSYKTINFDTMHGTVYFNPSNLLYKAIHEKLIELGWSDE